MSVEPSGLTVVTVAHESRCGCGEPLNRGEQAGQVPGSDELLCLWCLADVHAGRARQSHRRSPVVVLPPPRPAVTAFPAPTRPRRRVSDVWSSLGITALVVAAALTITHWPGAGGLGGPAGSSSAYAFMRTQAGTAEPIRFGSCRPIPIVVNKDQAPMGADQMLDDALEEVSRATGLEFVVEGETTEVPSAGRGARDVGRYGNRWSPVLVAWTDPETVSDLEGDVVGIGGPDSDGGGLGGREEWVSGLVYLDGPSFADLMAFDSDGYRQGRAIVMHEFGHLVGLDHVTDPTQLMAEENGRQTEFGAGDLEGLRRLGGGSCLF